MKKDIHPKYNKKAKVICACGNIFETGSTQDELKTELCSACHPFFTGKQKIVDTARRVEKFEKKKSVTAKLADRKGKTAKRKAKAKKVLTVKEKKAKKTDKK